MHTAHNRSIELTYETFGRPDNDGLLLISGLGVQMLVWPDEFCQALADRGFCVARFDNRDVGLSTHLTDARAPGWARSVLRPSTVPYRLEDMAGDALAVMDALGWRSAHVVGASMGGMLAQCVAVRAPERIRTLTSIMSTPSARIGTVPALATMRALARLGSDLAADADAAAEQVLAAKAITGSPGYPDDAAVVAEAARRAFRRHPGDPGGMLRQRAAIVVSGDRRAGLRRLRLPTLVIHGERDPLIRPVGGRATATVIPGAKLVTYPGMGHDLPAALWPSVLDEISALTTLVR